MTDPGLEHGGVASALGDEVVALLVNLTQAQGSLLVQGRTSDGFAPTQQQLSLHSIVAHGAPAGGPLLTSAMGGGAAELAWRWR